MSIDLYIYSGLGNIIAIIDSLRNDISINSEDVLKIYQNHKIDFDQLILVLPPEEPKNDFDAKIYNNDGSIASNCINGARCVSKFLEDHSLCASKKVKVKTDGGIWYLESLSEDRFSASFEILEEINQVTLDIEGQELFIECIELGNPHGVTFVDRDSKVDLSVMGEKLQTNKLFPDGVNFGLANIVNDNEINLRVYERGVGETLACGSGACAAALIGIKNKAMSSPVKVNFKQGSILVDYKIGSRKIYAEGSATFLEEIEISDNLSTQTIEDVNRMLGRKKDT